MEVISQNLVTAIINTVIIILAIIIIGRFIDLIMSIIIKVMAKNLGTQFTLIFANWLTFIGTIHHELSHALLLWVTGAKITKLELFRPRGDRLGQVAYVNRGNFILRSIQNTLSAIAPVILGCISEYMLYNILINCKSIIGVILVIYVMVSILMHMTMSKQDLKSAIKGLPVCFILLVTITYITKLDVVNIVLNIITYNN